jgi:hypothetical protein
LLAVKIGSPARFSGGDAQISGLQPWLVKSRTTQLYGHGFGFRTSTLDYVSVSADSKEGSPSSSCQRTRSNNTFPFESLG